MAGPKALNASRRRGKLIVRERLALLADPGTFRQFAGQPKVEGGLFDGHPGVTQL